MRRAARGYLGTSHGCVHLRDRDGVEQLLDQGRIGDEVVVHWSIRGAGPPSGAASGTA